MPADPAKATTERPWYRIEPLRIGWFTVEFSALHGTVTRYRQNSNTYVSGGGGAGGAPVSVSSEVITTHDIWIRTAEGKDVNVQTSDLPSNFSVLEGHRVTAIRAHGTTGWAWMAILDHAAGVEWYGMSAYNFLKRCGVVLFPLWLLGLLSIPGIVMASTGKDWTSAIAVALGLTFLFNFGRRKIRAKRLNEHLESEGKRMVESYRRLAAPPASQPTAGDE